VRTERLERRDPGQRADFGREHHPHEADDEHGQDQEADERVKRLQEQIDDQRDHADREQPVTPIPTRPGVRDIGEQLVQEFHGSLSPVLVRAEDYADRSPGFRRKRQRELPELT
jgi:hypothetical protein